MTNDAWTFARENFTDDDGSLPGIEFSHLLPNSVRSMFEYFRHNGTIVTENATLYDNSRESDVPLDQLDDPAGLVLNGGAGPFHCCFGDVSIDGVVIPVLGVFVFQDCVEISYRMGAEWNPENVDAFFRLLAHLKTLAPEAIVNSSENEGLPFPKQFNTALNRYADAQKGQKGGSGVF